MPTDATENQVKQMLRDAAGIFARLQNVSFRITPSYLSRYNTAYDNIKGQLAGQIANGYNNQRTAISNALLASGNQVNALLTAYAVQQRMGGGSAWAQIFELWARAGTPVTVKTRNWSFGSPSAGAGNVGDGTIRRNTKDPYGYDVESGRNDTREYRCVADSNSGAREGQERFNVTGTPVGPDLLDRRGLGINGTLIGRTALDTLKYFRNPSFGVFTLAAGASSEVSALTNWTASDLSDIRVTTADIYRPFQGERTPAGTGAAAIFIDDNVIVQNFGQNSASSLERGRPYYAQIAFKRLDSCDGTLTFQIGSKSTSVALSAQSGWQVLTWKLDEDAWLDNFGTVPLTIRIKLSGRTTGSLIVDDIVFVPMDQVGPRFETLVGGQTPFQTTGNDGAGDSFEIVDAIGNSDCYMQNWFASAGVYMPASSSPTFTEPTP